MRIRMQVRLDDGQIIDVVSEVETAEISKAGTEWQMTVCIVGGQEVYIRKPIKAQLQQYFDKLVENGYLNIYNEVFRLGDGEERKGLKI